MAALIMQFIPLQEYSSGLNVMKSDGNNKGMRNGQDGQKSPAFNLPSQYVIHTVGPIIQRKSSNNLTVNCLQTATVLVCHLQKRME